MKKYRTTGYDSSIEEVEILRETESSVYIPQIFGKKKEQRKNKISNFHQYHDIWEQAHEYLLKQAEKRVAQAINNLNYETKKLKKIEAIKSQSPLLRMTK